MKTWDRFWWICWSVFALAWTGALLTTFPLTARDAVVPERFSFESGKLLHVSAYAVFTLLTSRLPGPRQRRLLLLVVLLHVPLVEWVQQFVGRTTSLADMGLDLAGVVLGAALSWRRWFGPS